jgi:deferrochelatase/peroxidase EfeB
MAVNLDSKKIDPHDAPFADVVQIERGTALRTEEREGTEHFGYVDGRSQPIDFATDLPDEGGTDKWDPFEPRRRVLVADPAAAEPDSFDSYFVFLKLEQDVRGFPEGPIAVPHPGSRIIGWLPKNRERKSPPAD